MLEQDGSVSLKISLLNETDLKICKDIYTTNKKLCEIVKKVGLGK